ncbi:amidase [Parapusillimonas sp. SGNA-6]|nr:amidase [Parapusillimonas sp. SGNA-6]
MPGSSLSQGALERLAATEAARLLAGREITAEALTRACLDRIAEREPAVHAWTVIQADAAVEHARALDRGPIRGLLHGLPLGVKDLFDTAGLDTAYGSPIYQGYRPVSDAATVSLCREAGAVVLGKTVTTEFATFQPGPTRNPHNLAHTPGGSSSGSAAAVADCMVPLAFGTQTAGSIIRPAAFCGVVGYKPSFGHVSRAGVKSLSETLDTVGGFGRTVQDAALLGAIIMRDRRLADLAPGQAPRIGLFRGPDWASADADAQRAMETAASALSAAGARVAEAPVPDYFAALTAIQQEVMAFEAYQALSHERRTAPQQISAMLTDMLERGGRISFAQHQRNLASVVSFQRQVDALFGEHDILMTPGAAGEAPRAEEGTGDPLFCRSWTLLGLPCVQLPVMTGSRGLPVGVQCVGRFAADLAVLLAACWVQDHLPR